jgi:hypothetical protein
VKLFDAVMPSPIDASYLLTKNKIVKLILKMIEKPITNLKNVLSKGFTMII